MRNPRSYGRPRLYIFEVSGIDGPMSGREVIVWWFVSGPRAYDIVSYYTTKLVRGTKFIPPLNGKRAATPTNKIEQAADELEVLPTPEAAEEEPQPDQDEENLPDPALAAIHVGRRVPVYRKLGGSTPSACARSSTLYSC